MIFLLDANVRTVKWNGIPLHEASSAIIKEEINGDFILTVRYPITDSGIYQLIKEDMLIKAPAPVLGAQLFRIKKPIENDDSLDITAYHVSDDIMKRSITPVSVVGQGCAMALSQMVQNAKTELGDFSFTSDIMDSRTFNTTETETLYSVLMDGKHSIVGTWEGELVRDNFALSIKRSRGADRGVVITTHKNLKSYQRTKNSQGVVTRIHARSTFKPDGAEDEVTLRVTVDSPLINSYPYINEKEYENNNAETVEELRKWAEAKFTNEGIDKVSDAIEIEAYELDGQVVHLGDTVNLKSRKHSADFYKKAIAYEFNALTEEYISITFDDKPGVGGSGVSSGLSNAADAILGASATAQDVAIQRAVKNANQAFDAEFDKAKQAIDDGIEQAKAAAELVKAEVGQAVSAAEAKANQALTSMQVADQKAANALNQAGASVNLAETARQLAAEAKANLGNLRSQVDSQARELGTKLTHDEVMQRVGAALNGYVPNSIFELYQTQSAQALTTWQRETREMIPTDVARKSELTNYVQASTFDRYQRETAQSIEQRLTETKALIPTEIGGVNHYNHHLPIEHSISKFNPFSTIIKNDKFGFDIITPNLNNTVYRLNDVIKSNGFWTVSFWAQSAGTARLAVDICDRGSQELTIVPALKKYSVTALVDNWTESVHHFVDFTQLSTDWLTIQKVKVERGKIASDHSLHPDALVTVADFNQVKETAQLYERVLGRTEGDVATNIARQAITSQLFQTEVASYANASDNLVVDSSYFRENYIEYAGLTFREQCSIWVAPKKATQAGYIRIQRPVSVPSRWPGVVLPLYRKRFKAGETYTLSYDKYIYPGTTGTIAFEIKANSSGTTAHAHFVDINDVVGRWTSVTVTLTIANDTELNYPTAKNDGLYIWMDGTGDVIFRNIMLTAGDKVLPYAPNPNDDERVQTGTDRQALTATTTRVTQLADSWAVKALNSHGDVLSAINVATGGISAQVGNNKLVVTPETTYIENGTIKSAMIDSLYGGKIVAGTITGEAIGANVITGRHIRVDQALFDKLIANEAYLRQLFAKQAFITQVQSIDLSASRIKGGILQALNGAMSINLNGGQILYYTDQAALKRVLAGYPTQFVKFATGQFRGKPAGVTVIGSNRWGSESSNDGGFVGIRAWNSDEIDLLDLVGDDIRLTSSAYDNSDGWDINTLPGKLSIDAHRASDRPSSRLNIGDVHLFRTSTDYTSLMDVLQQFNTNFKHLVNITGRGDVILTWGTIK